MSNKCIIEIFKGDFKPLSPSKAPHSPSKCIKAVVFDLDETLGSFSDLYLLWSGIKHIYADFNDFSALLDLYPEFLRCNILSILQYLYQKKIDQKCDKIYIYTNNQCKSHEWVYLIMNYFNDKVSSSKSKEIVLFDKVISTFKIGNKRIELSRTTHEKTHSDLINSTMLPKNTEICFIDDKEYIQMKQDKVYYICPKAYSHSLSVSEMIERLIHSNILHPDYKLLNSFDYWLNWFSLNNRSSNYKIDSSTNDNEINKIVSKKIMYYIREFFVFDQLDNRYPTI
jgi:hypothetical protein